MRKLVWTLGIIAVVIWSLFSLGAYGFVAIFGDFLIRNADAVTGDPETVVWLAWTLDFVQDFGVVLLFLLWALVAAIILAATWAIARLVGDGGSEFQRLR